ETPPAARLPEEERRERPCRPPRDRLVKLRHLRLDSHALPEDPACGDPTVDQPAIVPDLEALTLDRLHDVEVLIAVHLAEHDFADDERHRIDRLDGDELPGLDSPAHGAAAGAELDGDALLQLCDVVCGPAHRDQR